MDSFAIAKICFDSLQFVIIEQQRSSFDKIFHLGLKRKVLFNYLSLYHQRIIQNYLYITLRFNNEKPSKII